MRISASLVAALFGFCVLSLPEAYAATPTPAPSSTPVTQSDAGPCGAGASLLSLVDRPTVGFSVCPVTPGRVLLEAGYQNTTTSGQSGGQAVQYPQGLLRVGVGRSLEADFIVPNVSRNSSGRSIAQGTTDSGAGLKVALPSHGRWSSAIDGLFTIPTGSGGFSSGAPTYTGNLDLAYAASPDVGIASTLAVSSVRGAAASGAFQRYVTFMPSVVLAASFPHDLQAYAELVYVSKTAPDAGDRTFIDYGLQKLLSKNVEVDLELGNSLTASGSAFRYIGAGFALQL